MSYRLVLASLLIGTVLSVFSTGVQLYTSFSRQKADATQELDLLEKALAPSLARALWEFNFSQVEIILEGLVTEPFVGSIQLSSPTGHQWSRGFEQPETDSFLYELIYSDEDTGENHKVGEIRLFLSLETVRDRVWAEFWTILTSNVIKAYLGAIAFFFVVQAMVIRHLRDIAKYINQAELAADKPDLSLNRAPSKFPDQLDTIASALREYQKRALLDQQNRVLLLEEKIEIEAAGRRDAELSASAKTTFLATMSHEIRTPLNAILGLFQLIEHGANVPKQHRTQAATGYRAAYRLLEQLVNVVDVSRLDSAAIEINPRPTEIRRLAQQWLETTKGAVHRREKPIKVTLKLENGLDDVYMIDGPKLSQIVHNLTDNATKFTDNGEIAIKVGRVELEDTAEGHGLYVSISDTGIGISEQDSKRIFERFKQLDEGIVRRHGGSGLGLFISNELAQLMNAELKLRSPDADCYNTEFMLVMKHNLKAGLQHEKA